MFFQTVPGSNPGISRPFIVGLVMLLLFLSMQVSLSTMHYSHAFTYTLSEDSHLPVQKRKDSAALWLTLQAPCILGWWQKTCCHVCHAADDSELSLACPTNGIGLIAAAC